MLYADSIVRLFHFTKVAIVYSSDRNIVSGIFYRASFGYVRRHNWQPTSMLSTTNPAVTCSKIHILVNTDPDDHYRHHFIFIFSHIEKGMICNNKIDVAFFVETAVLRPQSVFRETFSYLLSLQCATT